MQLHAEIPPNVLTRRTDWRLAAALFRASDSGHVNSRLWITAVWRGSLAASDSRRVDPAWRSLTRAEKTPRCTVIEREGKPHVLEYGRVRLGRVPRVIVVDDDLAAIVGALRWCCGTRRRRRPVAVVVVVVVVVVPRQVLSGDHVVVGLRFEQTQQVGRRISAARRGAVVRPRRHASCENTFFQFYQCTVRQVQDGVAVRTNSCGRIWLKKKNLNTYYDVFPACVCARACVCTHLVRVNFDFRIFRLFLFVSLVYYDLFALCPAVDTVTVKRKRKTRVIYKLKLSSQKHKKKKFLNLNIRAV